MESHQPTPPQSWTGSATTLPAPAPPASAYSATPLAAASDRAVPPVVAPPPDPGQTQDAFGEPRRSLLRRIGGGLAVAGAAIGKFLAQFKALLLLAPKVKLLVVAGSALVSVVAYSLFWGWTFAVGFVVLIFLHEIGHVIQLRREGIKASAPVFIPFIGAAINARLWEGNALTEARVGLAGPVLGTIAAAGCVVIHALGGGPVFLGLAYVGFLLNLFNLLPVLPFDGGRAMAAMAPWMWFVGFAALIPVGMILRAPIVLLVLLFGGREIWVRWRQRRTRSLEQAAYYRVSPRDRVLVGTVYIGLIVALAFGMYGTYIHHSI